MNPELCEQFYKNSDINPITNRRIKKDGPVYKKLMRMCSQTSDKTIRKPTLKLKRVPDDVDVMQVLDQYWPVQRLSYKQGKELHGKTIEAVMGQNAYLAREKLLVKRRRAIETFKVIYDRENDELIFTDTKTNLPFEVYREGKWWVCCSGEDPIYVLRKE